MTGRARQSKRVGPGQRSGQYPPPMQSTPAGAPPDVDAEDDEGVDYTGEEPTSDSVVTDTADASSFQSVQPGTGYLQSEVHSEYTQGEEQPGGHRTNEPRDNGEGKPRGFIVPVGDRATKIPVRRLPGNDDMVVAREPVYVERKAAGSDRNIYTLLMPAGTVFPKNQLDAIVP